MLSRTPEERGRFGRILDEYIADLGLTHAKFARLLGGPSQQSTVHGWIKGDRTPRRRSIIAIAKALDAHASKQRYYDTPGHKLNERDLGYMLTDLLEAAAGHSSGRVYENRLWDRLGSSDKTERVLRVGMAECAPLFSADKGLAKDLAISIMIYIGFAPIIHDVTTWSDLFDGITAQDGNKKHSIDITGPIVAWTPRSMKNYILSESIGLSMRHVIVAPRKVHGEFEKVGRMSRDILDDVIGEPVEGGGDAWAARCDMNLFERLMVLEGIDGINKMYTEMRRTGPEPHPASMLDNPTFEDALVAVDSLCREYSDFRKFPPVFLTALPTGVMKLKFKRSDYFMALLPPEIDFPAGIGFALPLGERKLCDALNSAIKEMKRNGMMARVIDAHREELSGFSEVEVVRPAPVGKENG